MDLQLTAEQRDVVELFASVVDDAGGVEHVRAHEVLGFSPALWARFVDFGGPGMGVPASAGGGGASMIDLALAVEALGARVAPVPFVEHSVAARLLARVDAPADVCSAVIEAGEIATIALRPLDARGQARLVPAGAVARHVIALDGDELVLVTSDAPNEAVSNLASAPLADRALDASAATRVALATGGDATTAYARALDEWRALTASALVGLAQGALAIGCTYVTEREQFSVPIGTFQAIQHTLAEVSVTIDGAQLLSRKAAWTLDVERDDASLFAGYALQFAAEQAQRTTERVLHFHGGYGYMEEYDIQLFYRRAKGWPLVLDASPREYARLAALRFGAIASNVEQAV